MDHYICATCGTQFPLSAEPPAGCPICLDERQYIGWKGQQWTTLEQLRADHHSIIKEEEPGLTAIGTEPSFAIGQRAQLVQTPQGNVLWESLSVIDDAAIEAVRARGGLSATPALAAQVQVSPSRTRTITAAWWNGARPLAAFPSTCTPPSARGSCGPTPPSSFGKAKPSPCSAG